MRGVIYTAVGDVWIERAWSSINSLRKHMPDLPITVYTNDPRFNSLEGVSTRSVPADINPKVIKPTFALLDTPYEETLYIDADTYICGDLTPIFDGLAHCDMLVALQEGRECLAPIPDMFPWFNGGVIAYKASARPILELWSDLYTESFDANGGLDEPSLREAIYLAKGVSVWPLPPNYNIRTDGPCLIKGKAVVLHGKKVNENIACVVNMEENQENLRYA